MTSSGLLSQVTESEVDLVPTVQTFTLQMLIFPLKDVSGDFLYFSYCQRIPSLDPNQQRTDQQQQILCVSKI